jgi:hypothetical protein
VIGTADPFRMIDLTEPAVGMALTPVVPAVTRVPWQPALETFLDTLSSARTRIAYGRAVAEAMHVLGAARSADLEPPTLARWCSRSAEEPNRDQSFLFRNRFRTVMPSGKVTWSPVFSSASGLVTQLRPATW